MKRLIINNGLSAERSFHKHHTLKGTNIKTYYHNKIAIYSNCNSNIWERLERKASKMNREDSYLNNSTKVALQILQNLHSLSITTTIRAQLSFTMKIMILHNFLNHKTSKKIWKFHLLSTWSCKMLHRLRSAHWHLSISQMKKMKRR